MTQTQQKPQNDSPADRLRRVRAHMAAEKIDAFLIPRADEYMGEYVPPAGERLSWLTGFTGSAGTAAVLADRAIVTTDGRYDIQVRNEVDSAHFETGITPKAKLSEWLGTHLKAGAVVGYDPKLHTANYVAALETALAPLKIKLRAVKKNAVDAAWDDRPPAPADPVEIFPESIAGKSASDKRDDIAAAVKKAGAAATILTMPDSIAWLLNIRGTDVPHTPFALSFAALHDDGRVDWYIDPKKISPDVRRHLGNHVQVIDPATLEGGLKDLAAAAKKAGKHIAVDFKRSAIWFKQVLENAGADVRDMMDPCILPKACKNAAEQQAIINAHIRDGVAVSRFLAWADRELPKGGYTELDVVQQLESFRRADPAYRDSSFDTISGWAGNGAIVHYRANAASNAAIKPPGILLLDSGGQYRDGTTDITRTITVGKPAADVCENFTRVLRGHIAIASAKFPEGTNGAHIDAMARRPLWDAGLDYAHGTGHGVGCYLSVHEEGGSISSASQTPFRPGMVVSNEPGFYKEGAYGIRIENLILVKPGTGGMLGFDTITLAPIDRRLVRADMMNDDELKWLNDYHARVVRTIGPLLTDAADRQWLKEACAPIKKPDGPHRRPARYPVPGSFG